MSQSNQNDDVIASTNLTVLKRKDAHIQRILETASQVVLYEFLEDVKKWVERDCNPFFEFIVLNRRGVNDLIQNLDGVRMQEADPYLMYRNSDGKIVGIWFYDQQARVTVLNAINLCKQELKHRQQHQHAQAQAQAHAQAQAIAPRSAPINVAQLEQRHGATAAQPDNLLLKLLQPAATGAAASNAPASAPLNVSPLPVGASSPLDTGLHSLLSSLPHESGGAARLSKEELQRRLLELVRDPTFIDKVYAAYYQP